MMIYNLDFFCRRILEISPDRLMELIRTRPLYYHSFTLPKKNGARAIHSLRKVNGSKNELEAVLIRINRRFLNSLPLSSPAKGFVRGQSYQSYLYPHINKAYYMRLDIADFFGSVSQSLLTRELSEYVKDKTALKCLWDICTLEEKLPQGAPTSPALSNLAFRRIDQRILKYCQSLRMRDVITYTRYADDLLFSSNAFDFKNNMFFYGMVSHILKDNGFQINTRKNIFMTGQFSTGGYVLKDDIHLSRRKLATLNHILYYFKVPRETAMSPYQLDKGKCRDPQKLLENLNAILPQTGKKKKFGTIPELVYYLCGYRSYLISILSANQEITPRTKQLNRKVLRIQMILDELQNLE